MRKVNLILGLMTALFFLKPDDMAAQRIRVIFDTRHRDYERRDVRPPCPGPDYDWVAGRWVWDDYYRRDVWVEGYWLRREREYYCESNCCGHHEHRYKKQKHGHGHGYGRYKDRRDDY